MNRTAQTQIHPGNAGNNVTWLGPAVIGVDAPFVAGGPFPQVEKNIEIGLREDGVVVWRKAAKPAEKKQPPKRLPEK